MPDDMRGAVPHADIVPARGAREEGLAARLQQYLKEELAPFKRPRAMRLMTP